MPSVETYLRADGKYEIRNTDLASVEGPIETVDSREVAERLTYHINKALLPDGAEKTTWIRGVRRTLVVTMASTQAAQELATAMNTDPQVPHSEFTVDAADVVTYGNIAPDELREARAYANGYSRRAAGQIRASQPSAVPPST